MQTFGRRKLGPPPRMGRRSSESGALDGANVACFFTLASGCDVEFDGLALVEGLVSVTTDIGVVDKYVLATLSRDEAEALLTVEKLHCALHIVCFRFESIS